jgi:hypothetical protein
MAKCPVEKGAVMAPIARVLGVSLATAGLGAGLGVALFGQHSDVTGVALVLACVGGVIGAIAGAAREVVAAQGQGR